MARSRRRPARRPRVGATSAPSTTPAVAPTTPTASASRNSIRRICRGRARSPGAGRIRGVRWATLKAKVDATTNTDTNAGQRGHRGEHLGSDPAGPRVGARFQAGPVGTGEHLAVGADDRHHVGCRRRGRASPIARTPGARRAASGSDRKRPGPSITPVTVYDAGPVAVSTVTVAPGASPSAGPTATSPGRPGGAPSTRRDRTEQGAGPTVALGVGGRRRPARRRSGRRRPPAPRATADSRPASDVRHRRRPRAGFGGTGRRACAPPGSAPRRLPGRTAPAPPAVPDA